MSSSAPGPDVLMPGGLPVIGHALHLLWRPLHFVQALRDPGDVVVFRLGRAPAYMVNSPSLVREVLVGKQRHFEKGGPLFKQSGKLLGNGLAASNGALHLRQRRLTQPAFHHAQVAGYAEAVSSAAVRLRDSWQDRTRVDLSRDLHDMTMDILAGTLFRGLTAGAAAEIRRSLPALVAGVARRAFLPIGFVHTLPLPVNLREEAALQRLYALVGGLIQEYRATGTDRGDLLSRLLLARDPETGEAMDDRQIHDEIRSMMVAGTETSATVLHWALIVLGSHPDIEQRVHAEIDDVLGGRPATYADLGRLPYLTRLVQETLRMYPVGWILTRRAVDDVQLGQHRIPAGADVFFSPFALHRDPVSFPDPDRFDPDRWLPERSGDIPRDAYLPFGSGVRKCIGESFAHVEMMISLATLVTRWSFRPRTAGAPKSVARSTLRPKDPCMTAWERTAGQPGHPRAQRAAADGGGSR
ncbi:cytochrome P450 [Streptomyces sp. NPDC006733]|uniref:cytochrome P450 n=1 Tax=Streptomyces sp. NPDC006733 TaxID=3155460 RepID=UPI0033D7B8BE